MSKKAAADLLKSFKKLGYVETVVINSDDTIIAGHQRVKIMIELGWLDKEIDCRVPPRQLDQKEVDSYLLMSNKVTGEWDDDILANNFDEDFLLDNGWTKEELGMGGDDDDEIEGIDPEEKLALEVTCENEEQQRELFEELESRGLTCRLLTL